MANISMKDVREGMILADNVYSQQKQLIAKKGTTLNPQDILHMKFYSIQDVPIVAHNDMRKTAPDRHTIQTQTQRIRQSKEFQLFSKEYQIRVRNMRVALSDFIQRQTPIQCEQLLSSTNKLFQTDFTSFGMLDMLHNMREIDDSTFAHSINVALIARILGEWLELPKEDLDVLTLCGLLHDVGKAAVSQSIVQKPGRLTTEEYDEIKHHAQYGYDLLKDLDIDPRVKLSALMHHERCDGSGYPSHLTIDEIEPFAMIVSIADVYDAMTADRVYRSGLCPFDVVTEFQSKGLTQYHPKYIMVFLQHIANTYANSNVMLSDGTIGKIILINSNELTRPLIQTEADGYINLVQRTDLYISAII